MFEGLTEIEGWWIGPTLLAMWVVIGLLFFVLMRLRKARKSDDDQP